MVFPVIWRLPDLLPELRVNVVVRPFFTGSVGAHGSFNFLRSLFSFRAEFYLFDGKHISCGASLMPHIIEADLLPALPFALSPPPHRASLVLACSANWGRTRSGDDPVLRFLHPRCNRLLFDAPDFLLALLKTPIGFLGQGVFTTEEKELHVPVAQWWCHQSGPADFEIGLGL